ncbi:SDR family NAD(P)-dependent oxidoreductase [Candidatus Methylacidithermus pantelleriae]|uniref:Dihydropteridine reductase n=1 Tax=Candidatus Methylacidithermus pantelleriae TaxID=2744239 RepID=A0A8J2BP44_9BACT|nr:SDR family NAD(P)-dependent oxidoreductase [Candidatus Methylacidithermus pantelleriae]CAF0703477.1 Dihydropteridine reductase [Candidatus Methylacidithermus pantelleriae]
METTKVALVTGAGTGLGQALACRLGKEGWAVLIHYRRSKEGALWAAERVRSVGRPAAVVQADLSKKKEAEYVAQMCRKEFGRLDLLINNSGVYTPKPTFELTEEEWREGLDSTVTAAFFTSSSCLPLLRSAGQGRIINIGDSSAERLSARQWALSYHVGKTGLLLLTRTLARQEARYGVTVNMVSPGYLENSLDLPPLEKIPAGRYGSFEDIWSVISFLCQPSASYLTGSHIIVSGGWNLR